MTSSNYFNSLVEIKNNQPVTTSLKVAKIFGKQKSHVNRKIHDLVVQNGTTNNHWFYKQYRNYRGRQFPYYLMTKDGFSLLVMGFTGELATKFKIQFITAFDNMQRQLTVLNHTPSYQIADPIKRAERWIQETKHFKLVQKDDLQQRKVQRAFEASKKNVSVSHFAKMIQQNGVHMGRNRLFKWLRDHDYLMSSHIDKNVPYQQYVEQGLFRMTEYPISKNGHRILVQVTRITPKGQQYFMKLFMVGAR